jgi:hypothetical protein
MPSDGAGSRGIGRLIMRRTNLTLLALLFSATVTAASAPALAQSDQDRSAARSAALEGIKAYKEGRHTEAVDLLSRAEVVVHAPTHLLYLARAQQALGRLVEAREAYLKVVNETLPASAPSVFVEAQEQAVAELESIQPRLPKLRLVVSGAELGNVNVLIDGKPLSSASIGVPTPVNPGKHDIVVSADGYAPQQRSVELAEGASEVLEVQLQPGTSTASEPSTASSEPNEAATSASVASPASTETSSRATWGYALGGGGLVLAATGGVFGFLAVQQGKDAEDDPNLCPNKVCTDEGDAEVESAETKALVANIGIGAGLALVGVGAYLLLTDSSSEENPQSARRTVLVTPDFASNGFGLSVSGGF